MLWFGPHWGAPVNDENWHAPVPEGRLCAHCYKYVQQGDAGFIMNNVSRDGRIDSVVIHADCLFQKIGTPPKTL